MSAIPLNDNTATEVVNALGEIAQLNTKHSLTAQAISDEIEASKASRRLVKELPYQAKLIGFGNSITAVSSGVSFAQQMAMYSKGMYSYAKNAGVNGNTTTQMVARLSDIDGADAATIMEGANDAENGVTLDEHRDNITTTFNYCFDNYIFPNMIASPTADSDTRGQYIHEANIIDYITCRKMGVPMYDPWSGIVSDDGSGNQAAPYNTDGVHPNDLGHQVAGLALLEQIKNRDFYTPLPVYNSFTRPDAILNDNALFINATGNTPDNFSTFTPTSETLAVTELGIGNTYTVKYIDNAINFRSDFFPVTVGDTYLVVFKLAVDLISGEPDLLIRADYEGGAQNILIRSKGISIDDMLVQKEFTIPDGVTGIRFAAYAFAGTYEVDISIAQFQVYNLTHYGL